MEIDEIQSTVDSYVEYLGSPASSKNLRFFFASVPESLLPHPRARIEEALDYYINYFQERGDDNRVRSYENAKAALISFVSDEEAITAAYNRITRK